MAEVEEEKTSVQTKKKNAIFEVEKDQEGPTLNMGSIIVEVEMNMLSEYAIC